MLFVGVVQEYLETSFAEPGNHIRNDPFIGSILDSGKAAGVVLV
jgi:hypothetical protein